MPMTPFQFLNQFSFVILPLILFAAAAALLAWRRARWPLWAGWSGLLVLYLAYALTSGQASTERWDTPENIRVALSSAGQPTLVEFFSNY